MAQQAHKLSLYKPSRSEEIISEAEKEAALKKVCLTSFFIISTNGTPVMFGVFT